MRAVFERALAKEASAKRERERERIKELCGLMQWKTDGHCAERVGHARERPPLSRCWKLMSQTHTAAAHAVVSTEFPTGGDGSAKLNSRAQARVLVRFGLCRGPPPPVAQIVVARDYRLWLRQA